MGKWVKFSFGDGLKGNIIDKFDFTFLIEVFDHTSTLIHSQTNTVLDLNSFSSPNGKVTVKVTQYRQGFSKTDSFMLDVTIPVDITQVTVSPAVVQVTKGGTQAFTAVVSGSYVPSILCTWSITGNADPTTSINPTTGLLTIGNNETNSITVIATSDADPSKYGTATATLAIVPAVTNVSVSPSTASIAKGATQSFTATVTGTNSPSQTVNWSISGQASGATSISSSGVLTIGSSETSTSIIVKATSTVDTSKYGTATVTITAVIPPSEPNYLRMFVETNTSSSDFVSLNTIKNDYPKYDKYFYRPKDGLIYSNMPAPFYDGRNEIVTSRSETGATVTATDVYYARLFKLAQDRRNNAITIPEMSTYDGAIAYMTGLGIATGIKQHEIYLTYVTAVPNIIKSAWGNNYSQLKLIQDYLTKDIGFVTDWITWNGDIASGASAYATSPGGWNELSYIGHIFQGREDGTSIENDGNGRIMVKPRSWRHHKATPNDFFDFVEWQTERGTADPLRSGTYDLPKMGDLTFQKDIKVARVLVHETGHMLSGYNVIMKNNASASSISISDIATTAPWLNIYGWNSSFWLGKPENYGNPSGYKYCNKYITEWTDSTIEPPVTPYGCHSPIEDFAETYACYKTNPTFLQQFYPKRYNFMNSYLPTVNKISY